MVVPAPVARLERRLRVAEWFGWSVLLVLSLVWLAGSLQRGFLSEVLLQSADEALAVRHPRLMQRGQPAEWHVLARAGADGQLALHLQGALARHFVIEQVEPQPIGRTRSATGLTLNFATNPGHSLAVTLRLRPTGVGLSWGELEVGNARRTVTPLVMP